MLNIQENVDLTPYNTLHLKATASHYLILNQIEQLEKIQQIISRFPQFFVLGGGSNLILPTQYHGLVIHNQLNGITIVEDEQNRFVTAMAGENWDDFVTYCITHQAYGLENLSLIPGTVGASPIQNIGAYGVEVKDFIDEVLVFDLEIAQLVHFTNHDCQFSYRNSILKNNSRYIVISVTFKLSMQPTLNIRYQDVTQRLSTISKPTPLDLRALIIEIRQSKLPDPKELGNVGSFFHNPVLATETAEELRIHHPNLPVFPTSSIEQTKISAGWLIDNLGLKGLRQGNVGVYNKQALVLVNYGGACQSELLKFAGLIQARVKNHYQVHLNIEPIILN